MHQIKSLIDFIKRQRVGDHRVDIDLAIHIPIDNLWHISSATRPSKGGATPASSSYQLERTGADFLTRTGNANNDRFTPSFMRTFKRLTHNLDIADTFK